MECPLVDNLFNISNNNMVEEFLPSVFYPFKCHLSGLQMQILIDKHIANIGYNV